MNEIYENEITVVDLETSETEVEVDDVVYIETSTYRVYSDGSKVLACTSKRPKEVEDVTVKPTQLDVIEANTSYIVMMMEV